MSIKRVQKLLFSEYCDFEDMVLIESPFAQTTREGRGLRQVHLGLTPSKLVLATDVLPPVEKSCVRFLPGVDPDIETFELIAIYPIDCVNLSVFRRRKRQTIKAHFCNNRVFYFELGGFENRTVSQVSRPTLPQNHPLALDVLEPLVREGQVLVAGVWIVALGDLRRHLLHRQHPLPRRQQASGQAQRTRASLVQVRDR
jgi:hypothetical protein